MGLRDAVKRMTAGTDELHRERRLSVREATDATACAELLPRSRARVAGEVAGMRIVPRAHAPSLEVTVDDGTGSVVAVFFGRTRIGGLAAGRRVIVEGLIVPDRGRKLIYNPELTLLP